MRVNKRGVAILWLIALLGFSGYSAEAQLFGNKRKERKRQEELAKQPLPTPRSYYKRFLEDTPNLESIEGFITIHRTKDKLYFELPDSLLERDMLFASAVSEASDNSVTMLGLRAYNPVMFRFSKIGNDIYLRHSESSAVVGEGEEQIKQSLEKNSNPPLVDKFPVMVRNEDSTAYVFEATKLFMDKGLRLSPFGGMPLGLDKSRVSYNAANSFLERAKSFEDNLMVRTTQSYNLKPSVVSPSQTSATVVMTHTILLLDREPYRPRRVDSRVNIFSTTKSLYDSKEVGVREIEYAHRWRLEPSDIEAFEQGRPVEPVKPIEFYIDPDFPTMWRDYIVRGVELWNEAFEEIGFKNAVRALDYPTADELPDFDPENLKYSCVRYVPAEIQNAMGPSWVDPRSGEILNGTVYLFHNVVKLINSWIFVQTAAADPAVRNAPMSDKILGEGLKYVTAHEIGHCLGFQHNMGASATVPVDSLRSPYYTQKYGISPSIMDYARFNYVAQPGDLERGVVLRPVNIGRYDRFSVKVNYAPLLDMESVDEEYAVVSEWLREASADPIYRFGMQQLFSAVDPRSQAEDLGDDAVRATEYGVKNLKYILSQMNEWLRESDASGEFRREIYGRIVGQYRQYFAHVCSNVGGVYIYEKHAGDYVNRYESVPYDRQKKAMAFALEMAKDVEWISDESVLRQLRLLPTESELLRPQMMSAILRLPRKVRFSASKAEGRAYEAEECMEDIYIFVWQPTLRGQKLTESEMLFQKLFVTDVATRATGGTPSYGNRQRIGITEWRYMQDSLLEVRPSEAHSNDYLLTESDGMWGGEAILGDESNGCNHQSNLEPYDKDREWCCAISSSVLPTSLTNNLTATLLQQQGKDLSSLYYSYIMKVRRVLAQNKAHYDPETRMHYQYLLLTIDKILKQ